MDLHKILLKEEKLPSKDLVVFFNQKEIQEYGLYDPITNKIYINNAKKLISMQYLLAHELQHLIDFKKSNISNLNDKNKSSIDFNLELRAYARSSDFKQNNLDYLSENDFLSKLTYRQKKKFNQLKLKFRLEKSFSRALKILTAKYKRPN